MVQLEFSPFAATVLREQALRRPLGDIARLPTDAVMHHYFVLPLHFRVGDSELLEHVPQAQSRLWLYDPVTQATILTDQPVPPLPWTPLPLLQVVAMTQGVLHHLQHEERVTCQVPILQPEETWEVLGMVRFERTDVRFERTDGHVRVHSTLNGRSEQASIPEVIRAFQQFTEAVRTLLRTEVPELAAHAAWGPWLLGTQPAPIWEPPTELYEGLDLDGP